MYQQNKSSESKVKFRQVSNRCKRVPEAAKLAYTTKIKEPITSQKLGSRGVWRIANSVLNRGKSAIPPLFNGPEVLSSAPDKARLFAENFSKNSNFGISLPVFPSRTNLKLHNISITPKMVKKVITNLDSSKASGPDCIPVVVLKNCEPELSYMLAKLCNNCLKESCFPDCWKVSSVVSVFKNVGERSTAKNYRPASLLSVVSKIFERSTADLLTFVSDRIARAFNKSGATRAVALDISKAFNRVWHAGLLHKRKSYGISGQIFALISSFLSNRWLRVVLMGNLHKNIQLMLVFLKRLFLVLHFSYYTLMMMLSVILLSMLMILLSTLNAIRHLICGNNYNWLLNLNLTYGTLWTGAGSGLLISML